MHLTDTHAHVDTAPFDDDRAEVLARATAAGVTRIILAGAARGADDVTRTVKAAESSPNLFATVGFHPHEAKHVTDELLDVLRRESANPSVVAIGETGLDYHYNHSTPEEQKSSFRAHVALAQELDLPVVCHVRDAHDDTIEILRSAATGGDLSGVIHCFTGGPLEAQQYVSMGFYLSFSGIVTFGASAEPVRQAAREVPLERMLIETDSPYLAPVPMRGKRNEPAFIVHTVAALAALRGLDIAELAAATSENADRLFGITG